MEFGFARGLFFSILFVSSHLSLSRSYESGVRAWCISEIRNVLEKSILVKVIALIVLQFRTL